MNVVRCRHKDYLRGDCLLKTLIIFAAVITFIIVFFMPIAACIQAGRISKYEEAIEYSRLKKTSGEGDVENGK